MKLALNFLFATGAATLISCGDKNAGCPADADILETIYFESGETGIVTYSGEAYAQDNHGCSFLVQYFTEGWDDIYVLTDSGMYVQTDEGDLFPITNTFYDDMESYTDLVSMMAMSVEDTDKNWNSFTLQSPLAPTIEEYVDLRTCILTGGCDFLDNRVDIVTDPVNAANKVMQCTAVAPSADMVTSKSSIDRTFNYFNQGMDLYFEMRCYIASGMPYSLVDFENDGFDQSPGPRVVIMDNSLAIENKFGDKTVYYSDLDIDIPTDAWFTVKVHFRFSNQSDGIIELWQDGNLLISTNGINLPLATSVQNSLEVGVSATDIGAVLLVDDVRLSPTAF